MRTVGRRDAKAMPLEDQGRLSRTASLLRGHRQTVPRGLYRFRSFEEADSWMTRMMARTHVLLSRKTSSGSAPR